MKVSKPNIGKPKWDFIAKIKIPIPFSRKVKVNKPHLGKGFIKRTFRRLLKTLKITL